MKKLTRHLLCGAFFLCAATLSAQQTPQKDALVKAEEEAGPLVFKFEPGLIADKEARRIALLQKKAIIDTLDISESKRLKLLKDLYQGKESKRLQKYLLADNAYEDTEYQEPEK